MKGVPSSTLLNSGNTGRSCFLTVDMNPLGLLHEQISFYYKIKIDLDLKKQPIK